MSILLEKVCRYPASCRGTRKARTVRTGPRRVRRAARRNGPFRRLVRRHRERTARQPATPRGVVPRRRTWPARRSATIATVAASATRLQALHDAAQRRTGAVTRHGLSALETRTHRLGRAVSWQHYDRSVPGGTRAPHARLRQDRGDFRRRHPTSPMPRIATAACAASFTAPRSRPSR